MNMGKIVDRRFSEAFGNLIAQDLGMKMSLELLPWIKFIEANRKDCDYLNGLLAEKFIERDDKGEKVKAFDENGKETGFAIKSDSIEEYLKESSVVLNKELKDLPKKIPKADLLANANLKMKPVDLFHLEDILE